MKKNKNGFTKQGVRDLSHIKGNSIGRRLEMPPDMESQGCNHPSIRVDGDGDKFCTKCNACLF